MNEGVIHLHGDRTSAYTGETKRVELTAFVQLGYGQENWLFLRGGPTGHESISLGNLQDVIDKEGDWLACMGTPYIPGGRAWDRLVVAYAELRNVQAQLEQAGLLAFYQDDERPDSMMEHQATVDQAMEPIDQS